MTLGDKVEGVAVTVATVLTFAASAVGALVARPDGLGLLFAIGSAVSGCCAVASVIRDRL